MGKQYDEIVVVLAPVSVKPIEVVAVDKTTAAIKVAAYDAFIYTDLKNENLSPFDHNEAGQPESISGLPLAGKEQILINWAQYQKYIISLFTGETAARAFLRQLKKKAGKDEISNALFEVKGNFLNALFDREQRDRPLHVWWHSERAELVALPWELMVHARSWERLALAAGFGPANVSAAEPLSFSFTRGLPPQTPRPKVLVNGPLRLAFIHEPRSTSKALLTALHESMPGIEITDMTGPPRAALQAAASEGYEIIHLVADGSVSLANDGTLYLLKTETTSPEVMGKRPGRNRVLRTGLMISEVLNLGRVSNWLSSALERTLEIDKCSPSELCEILRGSRVSVLSLSAPKTTYTERDRFASYLLPKVYRAFCSLGTSTLSLPTIVSPVGATDDAEIMTFWRGFYTALGEQLNIQTAMASAFENDSPIAMALFLRHPDGEVFHRVTAEERETAVDPVQLDAALQLSQELVAQLEAQVDQSEPIPESFKKLLSKELDRQARLKSQLKTLDSNRT